MHSAKRTPQLSGSLIKVYENRGSILAGSISRRLPYEFANRTGQSKCMPKTQFFSFAVLGVGGDRMRSHSRSGTFFSCALRNFPSKSCCRIGGGETLWQGKSHESLRSGKSRYRRHG
jgi:hypothetical protein